MKKASNGNTLLWLVAAAFAVQITAWILWLNFASKHRPTEVPLHRVVELVRLEAARFGVTVTSSELIGGARLEEILEVARYYLGLHDLRADQVLDLWALRLGDRR